MCNMGKLEGILISCHFDHETLRQIFILTEPPSKNFYLCVPVPYCPLTVYFSPACPTLLPFNFPFTTLYELRMNYPQV